MAAIDLPLLAKVAVDTEVREEREDGAETEDGLPVDTGTLRPVGGLNGAEHWAHCISAGELPAGRLFVT